MRFMVSGVAAVALASGADGATSSRGRAPQIANTLIYSMSGRLIARIPKGEYGASGECWYGRRGGKIYVGITHNTWGGASRDGAYRWNVWTGRRRAGILVFRKPNRWYMTRLIGKNIYGARVGPIGRVGYTIGINAPDVGAAFILLGLCE